MALSGPFKFIRTLVIALMTMLVLLFTQCEVYVGKDGPLHYVVHFQIDWIDHGKNQSQNEAPHYIPPID